VHVSSQCITCCGTLPANSHCPALRDSRIVTSVPRAVPPAQPIGTTGLCVVPGWEYAARWSILEGGEPYGYNSPSIDACATDCAARPDCTGATYIDYATPGGQKNCWLKAWGAGPVATPCQPAATGDKTFNAVITPPAGSDCTTIAYNGDAPMMCDAEQAAYAAGESAVLGGGGPGPAAASPLAVAPDAAAAPTPMTDPTSLATLGYSAYPMMDYSPNQMPPPAVPVTDLTPKGQVVDDAAACAEACTAMPECNAASYYGDNPMDTWPGELPVSSDASASVKNVCALRIHVLMRALCALTTINNVHASLPRHRTRLVNGTDGAPTSGICLCARPRALSQVPFSLQVAATAT
jgi:PAN domain